LTNRTRALRISPAIIAGLSQKGFSLGAIFQKIDPLSAGRDRRGQLLLLVRADFLRGCAFCVNGISWRTRVDSSLQALERVFLFAAKVGAWCAAGSNTIMATQIGVKFTRWCALKLRRTHSSRCCECVRAVMCSLAAFPYLLAGRTQKAKTF
jgi:hypothetical protein